ncbi:MAG: Type 1 glutamine amidotransferase-like domain-containing protein [Candidatus Levybacteria bacterium]|nr:Type 1 glutamine amidotransferase-like domain-containing protein [Candidatus Levybacteria bacterium]
MNLFLTSFTAYSLNKILPLLPKPPSELKVAFIPTASDLYKYRPWINTDKDALVSAGFKVFEVGLQAPLDPDGFPIAGKDKLEAELRSELTEADIIFVAGGNTFYLLEQAQKSGFLGIAQELVEEGKIYIGSSAGSIITGPDIMPVEYFDEISESNISSTRGLNWVDFVILAHYDEKNPDPEFALSEAKYKDQFKILKLSNDDLVHVSKDELKVI